MEFHCKLTLKLPEEAIRLFGINEDTVFETYFEDGDLVIRPISEDELSVEVKKVTSSCDGDCETCIFEECCPYDDSIVRQMIECIKVYPNGKLEIIFGGGVLIDEKITAEENE